MKRSYTFYFTTGFVGSRVSETIEFDFDEDATEAEIESELQQYYEEWIWRKVEGGWEQE